MGKALAVGIGLLLEDGTAHLRAGHVRKAEAAYRRVLKVQSNHLEALHLLGVATFQAGRYDDAERLLRRAVAGDPRVARYYNNLGNLLHSRGKQDDAIAAYRRAVELDKTLSEASQNLADIVVQRTRSDRAGNSGHRGRTALPAEVPKRPRPTRRQRGSAKLPTLFYGAMQPPNFGDELNASLWERFIPGLFGDAITTAEAGRQDMPEDDVLFVGIGTLLNGRLPPKPRKLVFGTGCGYGAPPPVIDGRWKIYCVRGPRTAKLLNIDLDLAITDPGMLVGQYTATPAQRPGGWGFMPHHFSSFMAPWREICEAAGVRYIDPALPVDDVIAAIAGCDCLIAEALHGAITADALRVPWIAVEAYPHILRFKWLDWCESIGLEHQPNPMSPIPDPRRNPRPDEDFLLYLKTMETLSDREVGASRLAAIKAGVDPKLSRDDVHDSLIARLLERLDTLRRDLGFDAA